MPTIRQYTNQALDKAYSRDSSAMFKQIDGYVRSGVVQSQVQALIEEAERLEDEGEGFTPNDAQLNQTLGTVDDVFNNAETAIIAHDNTIQESAVKIAQFSIIAQIIASLAPQLLGGDPFSATSQKRYQTILETKGVDWTTIEPNVINQILNYVDSQAYLDKMAGWGDGYAAIVRNKVLTEVQRGNSPIYIAREIDKMLKLQPRYVVENFTRTLQLTGYRDAELAQATANQAYIAYKIRNAVKDLRTCPACLELDGTRLRADERIDDHFKGRCFAIYVLPGQTVKYQTAKQWFNGLPEPQQAQLEYFKHNKSAFRAWQSGEVQWNDFVGEHTDPLFGKMPVANSLTKMVGKERALELRKVD